MELVILVILIDLICLVATKEASDRCINGSNTSLISRVDTNLCVCSNTEHIKWNGSVEDIVDLFRKSCPRQQLGDALAPAFFTFIDYC